MWYGLRCWGMEKKGKRPSIITQTCKQKKGNRCNNNKKKMKLVGKTSSQRKESLVFVRLFSFTLILDRYISFSIVYTYSIAASGWWWRRRRRKVRYKDEEMKQKRLRSTTIRTTNLQQTCNETAVAFINRITHTFP